MDVVLWTAFFLRRTLPRPPVRTAEAMRFNFSMSMAARAYVWEMPSAAAFSSKRAHEIPVWAPHEEGFGILVRRELGVSLR